MATTVVDFGESKEKTLFTGSSEEDIACAKGFWQSVQLNPTIESRLVSSDVKQRLKVAPQAGQGVNHSYKRIEYPPQLTEFLETAHSMEQTEELEKIQRLSQFREDTLTMLGKRKTERIAKETISTHKGITKKETFPMAIEIEDNDFEDSPEFTMNEIDKFNKQKSLDDDDDSD
ncbi:unnamed protein product [Owenia fusiformis]|uniref:Cilia- and flagella-associated protein HOATZ n=1 Tax=Owenia fusiformis TaxID=6347 RepID=A0A8J1XU72_OWEFU|nr:unnamed protein product [Owenia fusiformis]